MRKQTLPILPDKRKIQEIFFIFAPKMYHVEKGVFGLYADSEALISLRIHRMIRAFAVH